MRKKSLLVPIEISIRLKAMPSRVFRALVSQNELRKWWASHVAMSRNKVAQKPGQHVFMQLLNSEEPSFVRYIWRPETWEKNHPESTITLTIHDLGSFRQDTGEGLLLEIIHDGWVNEKEKEEQEKIWNLALESLKSLVEHNKVFLWWEGCNLNTSRKQINLSSLKQIFDSYKKESYDKIRKRKNQNLWKLCCTLEEGKWFLSEGEEKIIFQCENQDLLQITQNEIILLWDSLNKISYDTKESFVERLEVEQDIAIQATDENTTLDLDNLQFELWISWCKDLMEKIKILNYSLDGSRNII